MVKVVTRGPRRRPAAKVSATFDHFFLYRGLPGPETSSQCHFDQLGVHLELPAMVLDNLCHFWAKANAPSARIDRNGQKWSRRGAPGDYLSRNGRKWSRICSKFIGQWDRSHFDQLGSLYVATDCKMVPKWSTRHLLGCFFVTKWSGMVSESLVRPQRGQNGPIQSFGAPDPTPNWPQTAQDSPFAGSRPSQDPFFAL